jgi:hypothetical protein
MRFLGSLTKFSTTSNTIKFNIRLLRNNESSKANSFATENINLSVKRNAIYSDVVSTNLLSLNNDALQPLDKPTEIVTTSVLASFPGNKASNYFFWFDVPLAYDPCICKSKAMLAFSYEEIDTWEFKANGTFLGNYTATQSTDVSCNSQIPGQIIGGIVATASAISTNGASVFASTGGFTGLLKAGACALGMSNKDLKTLTIFTDVVEGASTIIDASNNIKPSSPKKTDKLRDFYISGTDTIKRSDIMSVISKSTKFLTSSYNLTTLQQAKDVKKAGGIQNNMQGAIGLDGTVGKKIYNWRDVLIAVPGSTWGANVLKEETSLHSNGQTLPEYPIYNEALGTLAFLKTPTVKYLKSNIFFPGSAEEKFLQDKVKNFYYSGIYGSLGTTIDENNPTYSPFTTIDFNSFKRITVRLNEDLMYFFNPKLHINLNSTAILAGYQYYVDSLNVQNSELVDIDDLRELLFTIKPAQEGKLYLKIAISFVSNDLNSKGKPNTNIQFFTIPLEGMPLDLFDQNLFINGLYKYPNYTLGTNWYNK